MTLDDAASQRQHASDIADSDVVKSDWADRSGAEDEWTPRVSAILVEQMLDLAIKREREECAQLVDSVAPTEYVQRIAAAIRARK